MKPIRTLWYWNVWSEYAEMYLFCVCLRPRVCGRENARERETANTKRMKRMKWNKCTRYSRQRHTLTEPTVREWWEHVKNQQRKRFFFFFFSARLGHMIFGLCGGGGRVVSLYCAADPHSDGDGVNETNASFSCQCDVFAFSLCCSLNLFQLLTFVICSLRTLCYLFHSNKTKIVLKSIRQLMND